MARQQFNDLHTLLSENDTLQPLLVTLRRVNKLQQIYLEALAEALPEQQGFAQASRVSAILGNTVVIIAANAPVAALLRQVLPRLLSKFQKQEQKLTLVRVEVQPDWGGVAGAEPGKPRIPLPGARLDELTAALSDSPLKQALVQIKRRRGKKS
jgi:hypothetical protein